MVGTERRGVTEHGSSSSGLIGYPHLGTGSCKTRLMSPSETDLQHRWQCLAPARTVPSAADALVGCVVSRGFDLGLEP
ncbi:uncharacterized protein PD653_4504 [Nocardioides sp. PD653]|nr:uncharacterized protein PD653B2_4685 [Nocardioides sp. PD653-B2]GAW57062.1 uncharacterized protein PD653_4504 [Nocardioides sp. PD653]